MTKHSYFPYSFTRHNTNRTHNIHHTPYTNILQHSKAQNPITFNYDRYTTNIPTDPHTITTTDIKINMRHIYYRFIVRFPIGLDFLFIRIHIHTYIVSRHLATRDNNKILRTPPPPHISSSEELLLCLTCRVLALQMSLFLKSYRHKVDAKSHPSPLFPFCNTNTHDTHHLFICTHIRTTLSRLDLWTDPAEVTELLARKKLDDGPQAGTSDSPH